MLYVPRLYGDEILPFLFQRYFVCLSISFWGHLIIIVWWHLFPYPCSLNSINVMLVLLCRDIFDLLFWNSYSSMRYTNISSKLQTRMYYSYNCVYFFVKLTPSLVFLSRKERKAFKLVSIIWFTSKQNVHVKVILNL